MNQLTPQQMQRYARSVALPQIGADGQAAIMATRILIVGCGALGSTAALYLAASGIGHMTLVDFDTIDLSNLQRQIAYRSDQLGESKAFKLAEAVTSLNPEVEAVPMERLLRHADLEKILPEYDIVLECSDNPATKLMVSDLCRQSAKNCVIGGVSGFLGQVLGVGKGTPTFRDIFGDDPGCTGFTPCSAGGVFAPAAAVVASVQAAEALKIAANVNDSLIGRLLTIDTLKMTFRTFEL
jgi:adenylyltransferase/sulfurtransferase